MKIVLVVDCDNKPINKTFYENRFSKDLYDFDIILDRAALSDVSDAVTSDVERLSAYKNLIVNEDDRLIVWMIALGMSDCVYFKQGAENTDLGLIIRLVSGMCGIDVMYEKRRV